MRHGTLAATLLFILCGSVLADTLHLKSGGRVEGVVTVEGDLYVIRSVRGTARVPRADVVKHLRAPYVTEIYEERRDALGPEDADGRFLLALWCSTNGLEREAWIHLEEVILIDPDHARARARLGYVSFQGVWMEPWEAKDAEMAARGYLRYDGRWFTPEGLKAWIDAKEELARFEEELAKKKAEREKVELAARVEAEKLAREKAERKALEQALARAEADRIERERLARQNQEILNLLRDMYFGSGLYGYSGYAGYSVPYYGRRYRRAASGCHLSGPLLAFRWSRGNLHVRGIVR